MLLKKLLIIFLSLFFLAGAARAEFIDNATGARPLALGEAYVAMADDGSAIFLNPAGLAQLKHLNVVDLYSTLPLNTRLFTLGAASPNFLGGTVGLGYNNLTTAGIPVSSTESSDYSQQAVYLSYGRKFNDQLLLGANLKFLSKGFSANISPGASGSGFDLDLALKYFYRPWVGVGLNLQNALPANLGGRINLRNGNTEGIALNLKAGLSAKFSDVFLNFDLDRTSTSPFLLHLGTEWRPVKAFALRVGLEQTYAPVYNETYTNSVLGFGLNYSGITFDFAYYQNTDAARRIDYYFSLGYVGREKKEEIKTAPTVEVQPAVKLEEVASPEAPITRAELAAMLKDTRPVARPTELVSRAEAVTTIVRWAGLKDGRLLSAPYPDVPGRHWAAPYISLAKEAGLLKFVGKKFEPKKKITRAEAAAMINSALTKKPHVP